jgi:c-di-GMP-binding flagellar brake protein YcgR
MNSDAASGQMNLTPGMLVVTPTQEGQPSVVGSVKSYEVGMAGLAVHLRGEVSATAVSALSGQRVWVSAHTDGQLIAFQATAQPASETALDLSGISAPVQEHRRTLVRAPTRLSAELRVDNDAASEQPVEASTIDLSRGGCRVEVSPPELPEVGSRVHLTIDLSGKPAAMETQVLRVNEQAGEAVLQFTSLDAEDAARIERHVLSLVLA